MNCKTEIIIPELWGGVSFKKEEWGSINYLVGPNGTGKSKFAEQLKNELVNKGHLNTRIINAERLTGLEQKSYNWFMSNAFERGFSTAEFSSYLTNTADQGLSSGALIILKQRLDLRIKIEATLSQLFNKKIRLVETGGFLKPMMQTIGGQEYSLKQAESHGLKELITLLTLIYDDTYKCLIIDEPELHLHPQYQSFFLQEIRKLSGDPNTDSNKKAFFLITHSPYFIDIRSIEELRNVLVFHQGRIPTSIGELDNNDEFTLKKFLPRLNTHHKQFFFSSHPIFVEGYTDQQIFTILLEKLERNIGAIGGSIIDVGGKEELDLFYRLCKKLDINGYYIADLDLLFSGRLKQSICNDEECIKYFNKTGLAVDPMKYVGEIASELNDIIKEVNDLETKEVDSSIKPLLEKLKKREFELKDKQYLLLLGLIHFDDEMLKILSKSCKTKASTCLGKLKNVVDAFKEHNLFLLSKGELENYYTQSTINIFNIGNKDLLFDKERNYLLQISEKEKLYVQYSDLINTLNAVVPIVKVDIEKYLSYVIMEWIQLVQIAVVRGEVESFDTLRLNGIVEYSVYEQILEVLTFEKIDAGFVCTIKILSKLLSEEIKITFDHKTIPSEFKLK